MYRFDDKQAPLTADTCTLARERYSGRVTRAAIFMGGSLAVLAMFTLPGVALYH